MVTRCPHTRTFGGALCVYNRLWWGDSALTVRSVCGGVEGGGCGTAVKDVSSADERFCVMPSVVRLCVCVGGIVGGAV